MMNILTRKNTNTNPFFFPLFLFASSFTVYLLTLSPTINSFDSAELIAGAYSLGIVHAPGYPLFLLVGHLFAQVPWGNPALNINLMSALFTSLSVVLLYQIAYRICKHKWSSTLAVIFFAFSPLIWMQAVITEVYNLNAFLLSLVILATLYFTDQPDNRRLSWLLLATGLSLVHHPTAILLLPITLFFIWQYRKALVISWRSVLVFTLCLAAPLLLYLYLPLRFLKNPPLNYVGDYFTVDLASFSGLWWMVSGQMFATELFGIPWQNSLISIWALGYQLWINMAGIGLIFAIAGLFFLITSNRNALTLLLGVNAGIIFLFFAFYNVIDNWQMIGAVQLFLTPLVAVGLARFQHDLLEILSLSEMIKKVAGLITLVVITIILLITNHAFADRHDDYTVYLRATEIMDVLTENSVVLTQWTMATPLEYLQIVEGQRPDVQIIDRGLLVLGIRDTLSREKKTSDYQQAAITKLQDVVIASLPQTPIFLTEDDPALRPYFCYTPVGNDLFQVTGIKPNCER